MLGRQPADGQSKFTAKLSASKCRQYSYTCLSFSLSVSLLQYDWEREDDVLPPLAMNNGNTLILHNVRHDDGGRYICHVQLEDGSSTTNNVDLVVKRKYRRRRYNRNEHPNRWWGN